MTLKLRRDDYTTRPEKVRIFTEPVFVLIDGVRCEGVQWSLDGIEYQDGRLLYTEACWSFDTFGEALAAVPEFWRAYVAREVRS